MSNTINFKYSLGDKVFAAGSEYGDALIECPSCFDKKVVAVTFGDGSSEVIPCPTCKRGYKALLAKERLNDFLALMKKHGG